VAQDNERVIKNDEAGTETAFDSRCRRSMSWREVTSVTLARYFKLPTMNEHLKVSTLHISQVLII
jgi:hypothetical protein